MTASIRRKRQISNIRNITIICGPTASGKSALAVALAREENGVIINADALQIYNALPVLTAQPSAEDKAAVPHRLYGALDVSRKCSAQQWRDLAEGEIRQALAEGRHPVVTGGTGLYLKALLAGLAAIPDIPATIRQDTVALQEKLGNPAFHAALQRRDPVMAARLNPNDTQRLIRAYEVVAATGKSLAEWQETPRQAPPPDWRFRVLIVRPPRAELHRRCDLRFDLMLEQGALEEVGELGARIDRGELAEDAPITHALGFPELRAFLRGALSREEAVFRAKAQTRQYVKRQDTWFRNQIKPLPSIEEIRFIA